MPKNPDDFRSVRTKLPPEAFALSEGPEAPASDLVLRDTRSSIVSLPDDVSLRTSDHYGSNFTAFWQPFWQLWDEWRCVGGALQQAVDHPLDSPIAHTACDATNQFLASICNACVGSYRLAFTFLRGIVKGMT